MISDLHLKLIFLIFRKICCSKVQAIKKVYWCIGLIIGVVTNIILLKGLGHAVLEWYQRKQDMSTDI